MISAVAEMYETHPQTLRLYEREGLLRPSRSEGNTRLYTEGDLERLELPLVQGCCPFYLATQTTLASQLDPVVFASNGITLYEHNGINSWAFNV